MSLSQLLSLRRDTFIVCVTLELFPNNAVVIEFFVDQEKCQHNSSRSFRDIIEIKS